MKTRTWIVGLLLLGVLIAAVYVLNPATVRTDNSVRIGIFQVVPHPVFDSMVSQFEKTVAAQLKTPPEFILMVGDGKEDKRGQIAQKFASERYDLVFVIGTEEARALVKKNAHIPIVLGAATEPQAAGLVASWDRPGGNVTGTSDLSPVAAQLTYLSELIPTARRVGIVFNPEETNSKTILRLFREACNNRGMTSVEARISGPADIQQNVVALLGKVDAIYAPTDATLQSNIDALIKVAGENHIPVFDCDESTAKKGALFSVGFNYADLGRVSGEMTVEILRGQAKPASMPIRLADHFTLFYNRRQIEKFGIAIPPRWVDQGKDVSAKP